MSGEPADLADRVDAAIARLRAGDTRVLADLIDPPATILGMLGRSVLAPRALAPGSDVDGFRVERKIGEGGMGCVYEATELTTGRRVALKVARDGHSADAVDRAVWLREARALGRLQHAHIACLHRAGTAADGTTYLALELVCGDRLDEYARTGALTQREVLGLCVVLARTVDFAHRRGVVHLDLKPSNVLVDEHGQIKVLDFGMARLAWRDGAADTQATIDRVMAGTLPYLAPEQVVGDQMRIDTRTDVYALGVILYELLCGARPHDVSARRPLEAARRIAEATVLPPSRRCAGISSELDAIALMALAKEPEARYASAAALAGDIERFLRGFPVAARAPSLVYRACKFAHRHRGAAVVLAVAVASTIGALAATITGFVEARRQARAARQSFALLEGLLAASEPEHGAVDSEGVRGLLREATRRVESIEMPAYEARTRAALGRAYLARGMNDEAMEQLQQALSLRRQAGVASPADLATSLRDLAFVHHARSELAAAEPLHREALVLRLALFGPGSAPVRQSRTELAELLLAQRRPDEARAMVSECVREARDRGEARDLADALTTCAELCLNAYDVQTALAILPEANELRARDRECPAAQRLHTARQWARALREGGREREAVSALQDVLASQRRSLGPMHPALARTLADTALAYAQLGDFPRAIETKQAATEIATATLGGEHAWTLMLRSELATSLASWRLGDAAAAAAELRAVCAVQRRVLGPRHADAAQTAIALAGVCRYAGDRAGQMQALTAAGEVLDAAEGSHWELVAAYCTERAVAVCGEDVAGALEWQRRAVDAADRLGSPDSRLAAGKRSYLACLLVQSGRVDEGREVHTRAHRDLVRLSYPLAIAEAGASFAEALNEAGWHDEARRIAARVLAEIAAAGLSLAQIETTMRRIADR